MPAALDYLCGQGVQPAWEGAEFQAKVLQGKSKYLVGLWSRGEKTGSNPASPFASWGALVRPVSPCGPHLYMDPAALRQDGGLGAEGPGGRVWGERKRSVAPGPGLCFSVNLRPRAATFTSSSQSFFTPFGGTGRLERAKVEFFPSRRCARL